MCEELLQLSEILFILLLHYVYLLSNIIKLKECYCSELKWYKKYIFD